MFRSPWFSALFFVFWIVENGSGLAQDKPPAQATVPVQPATSESARELLARVRPSIVQIEGHFGASAAPAFRGTGFAATANGDFLTNYHVVAECLQFPEKYRLEYRTNDGQTGSVAVLAVDIQHDLALVHVDGYSPAALKFAAAIPEKGERAYSIGFPLDVGLTITEGIANGLVQDSFDARLHYTGALNPGMSGGPAFNSSGDVIGVNVSGYSFQQLVSFLVPASHAKALLSRPRKGSPDNAALLADILAQSHAHSKALFDALTAQFPTQAVAGYLLPAKLAPFVDCNAIGNTTPNQPVEMVRIECNAKAGIQLQQSLGIGNISYKHIILTTSKLGAWRFANRLSLSTPARGLYVGREHVGPFACDSRSIGLKGFDANAVVCVRGYRKLAGLYDFTVRVSSLSQRDRGFSSHLDITGVEFDAGAAFVQRFLTSMEWKS